MSESVATAIRLAQASPETADPVSAPPQPSPTLGDAAPQALPDTPEPPASTEPAVVASPAPVEPAEPEGSLIASILDGISGFIELGGPVVALLLLLSVFALTIILLKWWQFARNGRVHKDQVAAAVDAWLKGNYELALAQVGAIRGPVARVLAFTMTAASARRDEAHVREETEHLALSEVASLRSLLRGLEAVAQVAPLLGLFGTVLGMIEAFRTLEAAGSQVNPADLAGGIWVALLTTAVGLAVAMPVTLVLHWFEGRVDRVSQAIELFATEVMTHPPVRAVKPPKGETMAPMRLAAAAGVANAA